MHFYEWFVDVLPWSDLQLGWNRWGGIEGALSLILREVLWPAEMNVIENTCTRLSQETSRGSARFPSFLNSWSGEEESNSSKPCCSQTQYPGKSKVLVVYIGLIGNQREYVKIISDEWEELRSNLTGRYWITRLVGRALSISTEQVASTNSKHVPQKAYKLWNPSLFVKLSDKALYDWNWP